jgi:hypothetical protein
MDGVTRLQRFVILSLGLFLLFFPKGGFKVAQIPLTWGYMLIFCFAFFCFIDLIFNIKTLAFSWKRWVSLLALIPFQIVLIFSFLLNGVGSVGFAVSAIVSLVLIPWIFVFVFGRAVERIDFRYVAKLIRYGVFFVATYGVFLFFYKILTGAFIEIPFVTVNSGDLGELDYKHIDRGGVFKLISTYNNGNIYGVCMLMLLPVYDKIERLSIPRAILKISLMLTLSRTVWFGLVLYELSRLVFFKERGGGAGEGVKKSRASGLVYLSIGTVFFLILVFYFVNSVGFDSSFLFDRDLGGRSGQLASLRDFTWLPQKPFEGISEIVYASVLDQFGFFGLVSFLLAFVTPLLVAFPRCRDDAMRKAMYLGGVIYLFVCVSDGAMLLIPVMAFYWFLVTFLLRREALVF